MARNRVALEHTYARMSVFPSLFYTSSLRYFGQNRFSGEIQQLGVLTKLTQLCVTTQIYNPPPPKYTNTQNMDTNINRVLVWREWLVTKNDPSNGVPNACCSRNQNNARTCSLTVRRQMYRNGLSGDIEGLSTLKLLQDLSVKIKMAFRFASVTRAIRDTHWSLCMAHVSFWCFCKRITLSVTRSLLIRMIHVQGHAQKQLCGRHRCPQRPDFPKHTVSRN